MEDAAAAGALGTSTSSAPMQAMALRTEVMTELWGVMQELNTGRGFLYPVPVGPIFPVWGKYDIKELIETLAFLWQELRLEEKKWASGPDGKDINKGRNALCAESIAQFIDIFPASAIRS